MACAIVTGSRASKHTNKPRQPHPHRRLPPRPSARLGRKRIASFLSEGQTDRGRLSEPGQGCYWFPSTTLPAPDSYFGALSLAAEGHIIIEIQKIEPTMDILPIGTGFFVDVVEVFS